MIDQFTCPKCETSSLRWLIRDPDELEAICDHCNAIYDRDAVQTITLMHIALSLIEIEINQRSANG